MEVAEIAYEVMEVAESSSIGNPNSITDAGVGAMCLELQLWVQF